MVKEIVSLTVASKAINHLEANLTKETNNKTMMKETEEDTKRWNDISAHGLEELVLLKGP